MQKVFFCSIFLHKLCLLLDWASFLWIPAVTQVPMMCVCVVSDCLRQYINKFVNQFPVLDVLFPHTACCCQLNMKTGEIWGKHNIV